MSNSLGKLFTVTSFGESHGRCVGAVIDGCPAGLALSDEDVQMELDRRKPDTAAGGTGRKEEDRVEILSGLFNGYTTGAPICMLTWNRDADSSAYEHIKDTPRPGHADYTAALKYGRYNDFRGGGRFSGRITAGFVMAGAVAKKLLNAIEVEIMAHTVQIGSIKAAAQSLEELKKNRDKSPLRCADLKAARQMIALIGEMQKQGDSIGGVVEVMAFNPPPGLGEPVFDTLEGDLAKAFFAIPAVKGVEFGSGFSAAAMRGSQNNDQFVLKKGKIITLTNNSGGIQGGLSNGMPVTARVAFKPTASIAIPQKSVNLKTMKPAELKVGGRHDACIVPRAVPVVESVMAIILCDFVLRAGLIKEVIR